MFVAGKIVVDVGRRMDVFVEREEKRERARGSGAAALCSKANAGSTFNVQEFKEKQTRGNFHVSGIPETWK